MDLTAIVAQIDRPRVVVVGDLILDRYVSGSAERVSPEAPVLVLSADEDEVRAGGAASVATLVRGLGANVSLAGVVGPDSDARTLRRLLADDGIEYKSVVCDTNRPTTCKERFIGRAPHGSSHQILRVDREVRDPISRRLEERLASAVTGLLEHSDVLLVSDYGKGVCTPGLLARLFASAAKRNVPVIVDPARIADYSRYAGATILIPNRCEAEMAVGRPIVVPPDAGDAGMELARQCGESTVIVKLDRDGMVLVDSGTASVPQHFPTRERAIYDVTGAGDMVLAVIGLCAARHISMSDAVPLANIAAGLEVERLGVVPVTRAEIAAEISRDRLGSGEKLVSLDQLVSSAETYRRAGRSIVFTNGCFDLLHAGHVRYLQQAATLGDVLVVAINSDSSVRRLKGVRRPVVGERDRAALISALGCVSHVLLFEEDTPDALLRAIRPEVLVKGGDYSVEQIIGREIVAEYGGRVCIVDKIEGVSTTEILSIVRKA